MVTPSILVGRMPHPYIHPGATTFQDLKEIKGGYIQEPSRIKGHQEGYILKDIFYDE